MDKIKIAVSSCLLGNRVRYDGQHKFNATIADNLGELFELVPFCPETAIGLGVPRPPIQLIKQANEIRVQQVDMPHEDFTQSLQDYADDFVSEIADIAGYVFKARSPSCGISSVPVLYPNGTFKLEGVGIFSAAIQKSCSLTPVISNDDLLEVKARENFIDSVRRHAQFIVKKN